jgi:hypothetical protein
LAKEIGEVKIVTDDGHVCEMVEWAVYEIGSPQRINFDPRIANLLGKIET